MSFGIQERSVVHPLHRWSGQAVSVPDIPAILPFVNPGCHNTYSQSKVILGTVLTNLIPASISRCRFCERAAGLSATGHCSRRALTAAAALGVAMSCSCDCLRNSRRYTNSSSLQPSSAHDVLVGFQGPRHRHDREGHLANDVYGDTPVEIDCLEPGRGAVATSTSRLTAMCCRLLRYSAALLRKWLLPCSLSVAEQKIVHILAKMVAYNQPQCLAESAYLLKNHVHVSMPWLRICVARGHQL